MLNPTLVRVEGVAEVFAVDVCGVSDYATSPYAAIGNGRVHYSTTSALPPTLLSASRHPRDVGAYTADALPAFYDRRDLLSSLYDHRSVATTTPDDDDDDSGPVELPRSRLKFIHTLGRGLFGDVSNTCHSRRHSDSTDLHQGWPIMHTGAAVIKYSDFPERSFPAAKRDS